MLRYLNRNGLKAGRNHKRPRRSLFWIVTALLFFAEKSPLHATSFADQFVTSDGVTIRYEWKEPHSSRKKPVTIILLSGRSSFIEKQADFMQDMTKMGFSVINFDWRGMGGSTRIIRHPQKVDIDSFDTYLRDVHELIHKVIMPRTKNRLIFVGSSMGGQLALRYLGDYPGDVQGAILAAPMLDVYTKPFPKWLAVPMVQLICALGFNEAYAFGHGDYDPSKEKFEGNSGTRDAARFWTTVDTVKKMPQYVTGGPTFGWVNAAFKSMGKTRSPTYLQQITQPVLMLTAGRDRAVNNEYDLEICHAMPKCSHKIYADSLHNMLKETAPIRNALLAEIRNFTEEMIVR